MRKLSIVSLFLFVIMSTGLFAGGSQESGKVTEIDMYFPVVVGGPLTKVIEEMCNDFMTQNPDVKVNPIYAGSYFDAMVKAQTAQQGGAPPAVAVLLSTELFTLIDMDAIIPMDDFIKKDNFPIDDFYSAFMENGQTQGKTWGLPFQRSTIVMYYNKDAFRKAGLDPEKAPATWEELVEYGQKLTVKDGNGNTTQWGVEIPSTGYQYWMAQALTIQSGKNYMNQQGNQVYFNDPAAIEALSFWKDMGQKYEIMPKGIIEWKTVPSDFLQQRTAIMYHSTGNLTNMKNNATFDFGVAFLPANKSFGSPTGGGNLYIFKDISDAQKEAAWKLVKFLTSPEMTAKWCIATGYVGTRASAFETPALSEYVKGFPYAAVARDQLQYAKAELSTHENGQVIKIINDNIQSALTGQASPEEALNKAQSQTEEILKSYK
ncbi:ABC transporter substrate-binding protein [Spirochaeta cellobiosiphila]|uniref:ABC transporter substrate-binding protein n=1 Tax=Spirochaeta cellobiosiphila TaxID=504483 RepID=UPI00041E9901|nr:ABC transporter substrate-binding protein [Spirochaeta cellobiosiphila]